MAYRKIHDDFWTDPDIEDLTPEQKYFYLYLITNPNVNQLGLYEFSLKRACFETGYNIDTVSKLLKTFESLGKIKRSVDSKEILIVKFYWHNKSNSPKMKTHVEQLLKGVKDRSLIQYVYGMDTASQEEEEEEEEKEQEKEESKDAPAHKPDDLEDVIKFFENQNMTKDQAAEFYHHFNGQGWVRQNGMAITSWQSIAASWIKREKHNPPDWKKSKKQDEHRIFDGGTW